MTILLWLGGSKKAKLYNNSTLLPCQPVYLQKGFICWY